MDERIPRLIIRFNGSNGSHKFTATDYFPTKDKVKKEILFKEFNFIKKDTKLEASIGKEKINEITGECSVLEILKQSNKFNSSINKLRNELKKLEDQANKEGGKVDYNAINKLEEDLEMKVIIQIIE